VESKAPVVERTVTELRRNEREKKEERKVVEVSHMDALEQVEVAETTTPSCRFHQVNASTHQQIKLSTNKRLNPSTYQPINPSTSTTIVPHNWLY